MALRAPTPLPAAGRGTTSRCPLIGLPPLSACYSTYLSCTRTCFAFAVARCCHRWCLVAFFVQRVVSSCSRRRARSAAKDIGRRSELGQKAGAIRMVSGVPCPLRWQGQTHPLSLQAAVAAAVSEESALLAAVAIASCCC